MIFYLNQSLEQKFDTRWIFITFVITHKYINPLATIITII